MNVPPFWWFASAVAEYGMLLRRSQHLGLARFERAIERARQFRGDDPDGDRTEFIALAEKAWALYRRNTDDAARGPGARGSMR